MINRTALLFLSLMIGVSILSSCNGKQNDNSGLSVNPTASESATGAPTEEPTSVPTEALTEASETIRKEKVVLDSLGIDLSPFSCSYLLAEETAWVFDNDVSDGLLALENFEETTLPAGTVLYNFSYYRSDITVFPGITLFILTDARCVFFDQSTSEKGEITYNGKTESELSDGMREYDYYDGNLKFLENYELLPNTPLDPSIRPQNIIINVDWNGDGEPDTIARECSDSSNTWKQELWYTDGATGEKTDISNCFAHDDSEEFCGLTDEVMLFEDEKTGRYALIDYFDTCSGDFSIFVYSYDPDTIIDYTETWGIFKYENEEMYAINGGFIFGNVGRMREPLIFNGKSVSVDKSVKNHWWLAAMEAKENGEALPGFFTYTLTDVSVEKKNGSGYDDYIIPADVAVLPQYYRWDENKEGESGYLYFLLVDGSEYRAAFEVDEVCYDCKFGGTSQNELFYCIWGG